MPNPGSVLALSQLQSQPAPPPPVQGQAYSWVNPLEGHYFVWQEEGKAAATVIAVDQLPHGTRPVLGFGEIVTPSPSELSKVNIDAKQVTETYYMNSLIRATKRKYERCLSWTLAVAEACEQREDAATALQGCYDARIIARIYGFEKELNKCHSEQLRRSLTAH